MSNNRFMPKIFSDLITEEDSITFVTVIAMGHRISEEICEI